MCSLAICYTENFVLCSCCHTPAWSCFYLFMIFRLCRTIVIGGLCYCSSIYKACGRIYFMNMKRLNPVYLLTFLRSYGEEISASRCYSAFLFFWPFWMILLKKGTLIIFWTVNNKLILWLAMLLHFIVVI